MMMIVSSCYHEKGVFRQSNERDPKGFPQVNLYSHCTIFCKRVNARAEIRHTNPLQCSDCKNILQSEHSKGSVWRISARAFTRLQKIVQCECNLTLAS